MPVSPSSPPDDTESDQFARKLRGLKPGRQLLRTIVGTIVVILVVGVALYVALSPTALFQPPTR